MSPCKQSGSWQRGPLKCSQSCTARKSSGKRIHPWGGASADHESPRCEFPQPSLAAAVCHEAETDWVKTRELGQFIWEKIRHDGIEGQKVEIGFFINKTQTTYQIRLCLKFAAKQDTNIFLCKHTHTHTHTRWRTHKQLASTFTPPELLIKSRWLNTLVLSPRSDPNSDDPLWRHNRSLYLP